MDRKPKQLNYNKIWHGSNQGNTFPPIDPGIATYMGGQIC